MAKASAAAPAPAAAAGYRAAAGISGTALYRRGRSVNITYGARKRAPKKVGWMAGR